LTDCSSASKDNAADLSRFGCRAEDTDDVTKYVASDVEKLRVVSDRRRNVSHLGILTAIDRTPFDAPPPSLAGAAEPKMNAPPLTTQEKRRRVGLAHIHFAPDGASSSARDSASAISSSLAAEATKRLRKLSHGNLYGVKDRHHSVQAILQNVVSDDGSGSRTASLTNVTGAGSSRLFTFCNYTL
jgi:hypothetical protein